MSHDIDVQAYFFRHGQTDWNKERRWQGHTDILLNEEGRKQALTLVDPLAASRTELIFSSDLQRALETAKIVSDILKIQIVTSQGLRECNLGQAEGKLFNEVLQTWGEEALRRWNSPDLDCGYPGGETKREQLNRTLAALTDLLDERPHLKRVGVSTHGMVIRSMLSHVGAPFDETSPVPNCSLHPFLFSRRGKVWSVRLLTGV